MADPNLYYSSSIKAQERLKNENMFDVKVYNDLQQKNKKNYSITGNLPLKSEIKMTVILAIMGILFLFAIIFPPIYSSYTFQSEEKWDQDNNKHTVGGVEVIFSSKEDVDNFKKVYLWTGLGLLILNVLLGFYISGTYGRRVVTANNYSKFTINMKNFTNKVTFLDGIDGIYVTYPWIIVLIGILTSFVYIGFSQQFSYTPRYPDMDIVATGNGKNFPVFFSENGSTWFQSNRQPSSQGLAIGYGLAYRNSQYYATGLGISSNSNIMISNGYSSKNSLWSNYAEGASFNIGYDIACGNSGSSSDKFLVAVGEGKDQLIYRNTSSTTEEWLAPSDLIKFNVRANSVAYGLSGNETCWVVVGENEDGTSPFRFSTNLTSWYAPVLPPGDIFYAKSVDYGLDSNGDSLWIATGRGTNTVYYAKTTPDKTWTSVSVNNVFFVQGNSVKYNPRYTDSGVSSPFWVATGVNSLDQKNIIYAEDPTSAWLPASGDLPSNGYDVTQYRISGENNDDNFYGKNVRIVVGSYPNIVTSDSQVGSQWKEVLGQEDQGTVYSITTRNPKYPLSD